MKVGKNPLFYVAINPLALPFWKKKKKSINCTLAKTTFWGKNKGKCIWEAGDVYYEYSRLLWNYLNTGTAVPTERWYRRAVADEVQAAMTAEQPCTSLSAAHFPNSFLAQFWAAHQPPRTARAAETPQPGLLVASLRFAPSVSIFLIPWLPVWEVAVGITGDLGLSLPGWARGQSSAAWPQWGCSVHPSSSSSPLPNGRSTPAHPSTMPDGTVTVFRQYWSLSRADKICLPFFFFFHAKNKKLIKIQDLI